MAISLGVSSIVAVIGAAYLSSKLAEHTRLSVADDSANFYTLQNEIEEVRREIKTTDLSDLKDQTRHCLNSSPMLRLILSIQTLKGRLSNET